VIRLGTYYFRSRRIRIAAVLYYVLLATGMPLPVRAAKDASAPFPCQSRGCSCRDAEQCARSCCCFPKSAQLAWYRERGLSPPFALLTGERDPEPARTRSPRRTCCSNDRETDAASPDRKVSCCVVASSYIGITSDEESSCGTGCSHCGKPAAPLTTTGALLSIGDESACRGLAKGGVFVFFALVPAVAEVSDLPLDVSDLPPYRLLSATDRSEPIPPPPRRA
jgi:hypothetical protein